MGEEFWGVEEDRIFFERESLTPKVCKVFKEMNCWCEGQGSQTKLAKMDQETKYYTICHEKWLHVFRTSGRAQSRPSHNEDWSSVAHVHLSCLKCLKLHRSEQWTLGHCSLMTWHCSMCCSLISSFWTAQGTSASQSLLPFHSEQKQKLASLIHDEYTLQRKGLPSIKETVCLFLTMGKFVVYLKKKKKKKNQSYWVNEVCNNKSSNSCLFMGQKYNGWESKPLIYLFEGVCVCVCVWAHMYKVLSIIRSISIRIETFKKRRIALFPSFL